MSLDIRPFVVTGCARSGTAYMSVAWSRLGLRCGHEAVFGPRTREFAGFRGQHGDSSWLAAPFLGQLPTGTVVVHRVRHPLRVVRSIVGVRFLVDRSAVFLRSDDAYTRVKWGLREQLMRLGQVEQSEHGPRPHLVYRAFLSTYAPQVWDELSPEERALRYWTDWTRTVMAAESDRNLTYRRHRLEDYDDDAMSADLRLIGLPVGPEHVQLVTESVPRDTNSRRIAPLTWDQLPEGPARSDAEALAVELGYDPRQPT